MVSRRSTNSWRASSSSFTRSRRPSSRPSRSVPSGRPAPSPSPARSRARAATRRVSGDSGMRPSRLRASSLSPLSTSSWARATTAPAWSGSISRARRRLASSPAATSRSASDGGAGARRATNSLTDCSGKAPMKLSTTCWPRTAKTAGMDCTRKAVATPGFSSTFTLASSTAPPVSSTTFSRMGPRVRQGPHHGAHRSTTTGTSSERCSTSVAKVESVTSFMAHPTLSSPPMEAIHEERVTAWFTENIEGVRPPLRFELIAGGRSNLTFRVTDASGQRFALRRPPLSHVLPTAHDMAREHRVIAALGPTSVPVPPALGYCGDEAVNGQPFYVMGFVEGRVIRDAAAARSLDPASRRRAGLALADVLVEIHAVDPDAVGLGDLGRREGYIQRQLRRWQEQFTRSQMLTRRPVPAMAEVHARLGRRVPPQGPPAIVHGDYRLDNALLDDTGEVLAVLDWEICTLGDPLADVGLLMGYWTEAGDDTAALVGVTPTAVPGFATRAEIKSWYAAKSGRDLSRLDFYVAFGYWKLACILQGVYARYVGGAAAGDRSSVDGFARSVVMLAEAA